MKEIKENVNEGRPIPMDTPNEFAYRDFKKHAYKNRSQFKKDMVKHGGNGSKMFMTLSALWYKWAYKHSKDFKHIKDKLKFGRALMVMMVKDDLIFDKKAWKKDNNMTHVKEGKLTEDDLPPNDKGLGDRITIPKGKEIVLQADTTEHERGLIVKWKDDGGYDVAYWYDTPDKIVPAELRGADTPAEDFNKHGESYGDVKHVWLGYHPSIDKTYEAKQVNEIKKGDWIRSAYDELGLVNKVKGQAAYVSFDGSRSFQPMRVADLQKTKERHRGKAVYSEGKLTESMIGIQTKANFKPNQLKGALEKAGVKGFQMNRLSVTLTALKLDKKYYKTAMKIVNALRLKVQMAKENTDVQLDQAFNDAKPVEERLKKGESGCCHKCGHSHPKGGTHPTPYKTGKNSCASRKNESSNIIRY